MGKKLLFSSFALKIIAIVFMTLDHVGLLLVSFSNVTYAMNLTSQIFRTFGRLAMPLFVFMIVEGVLHTKSIKKYFLRLGIIAFLISAVLAFVAYVPLGYDVTPIKGAGNIFLDLLLTALTIYLIKQPKISLKFLTLLPIGLSILSFCVKCYEQANRIEVLWYPCCFYLQYDLVSIALGLGFYLSTLLAEKYVIHLSKQQNVDRYVFDSNGTTRLCANIISILMLFMVCLIHYLTGYYFQNMAFWDYAIQSYAVLSGAIILFYNGKRGYNAKWFQYGCYIYYPLSIALLFIIYMIIGG